jgi:hypothetical protein
MGLAVIAVLLVMMVFVWLQVARAVKSAKPTPPLAQPTSLVWGNRVFQTETQLKRWVEERGMSYSTWAARHRGAVAVIEHRLVTNVAPSQKPAHKQAKAATSPYPQVRRDAARSAGSLIDRILSGAAWTLALLLGAAALAPRRLAARVSAREFGSERRVVVAGAALAVGLGLLVAGSGS